MGELNTTKKNILIVEDDRFSQTILTVFLRQKYATTIAENGKQALAFLENGLLPQLIISDLNTPEISGFQLLKILKANEKYCTIPFIVLSGDDSNDQQQQCLHAGATAFIVKPFNPITLGSLIELLLAPSI
jgi:CheY-like chemotaxis protein